jgi:hypothetical protein
MDAIASATCMHHSSYVVSAPISLTNTHCIRYGLLWQIEIDNVAYCL